MGFAVQCFISSSWFFLISFPHTLHRNVSLAILRWYWKVWNQCLWQAMTFHPLLAKFFQELTLQGKTLRGLKKGSVCSSQAAKTTNRWRGISAVQSWRFSRSQPKFWRKMKKIGGVRSPGSPAFRMYDKTIGLQITFDPEIDLETFTNLLLAKYSYTFLRHLPPRFPVWQCERDWPRVVNTTCATFSPWLRALKTVGSTGLAGCLATIPVLLTGRTSGGCQE